MVSFYFIFKIWNNDFNMKLFFLGQFFATKINVNNNSVNVNIIKALVSEQQKHEKRKINVSINDSLCVTAGTVSIRVSFVFLNLMWLKTLHYYYFIHAFDDMLCL